MTDPESLRLLEEERRERNWKRWGPYLAERQWATVREDYSAHGDAWGYFPHEHARSRAYRWGEDGLLGFTDRDCRLCFALALWNERDPILKERLFGLGNPEGNHGEDVKECLFHLDATPTHSYVRSLYKYPQAAFPYEALLAEARRRAERGPREREPELADTGIFDEGRYFDVFAEYAKATPDDILIRLTIENRGPDAAPLHVLPTLWFRNTWAWGRSGPGYPPRPSIEPARDGTGLRAEHQRLGAFRLALEERAPLPAPSGRGEPRHSSDPLGPLPQLLFTGNETNAARLFGAENRAPFVKDAFHDVVVAGRPEAASPAGPGTKAAAHLRLEIPAGGRAVLRLRLFPERETPPDLFGAGFERVFAERTREADLFFAGRGAAGLSLEERRVERQAYATLLATRQFYYLDVQDWLAGDPAQPAPPAGRGAARNGDWMHLHNRDVVSVPDKWEYPWYAAWDLAFHAVAFAPIDPAFAKAQLLLLLRERYMHPNGQVPAYEFNFGDVNPPVHAWACWRVYKTAPRGQRDRAFLERAFHKLLLNFTWWVNRKDVEGKHVFAGGFLGLDNIGVFDRSRPLPGGGRLEQADGTAWMGFYCGALLAIALELAREDPVYEDIASKFFDHFVAIADAMNTLGGTGLWDEEDGFYYDKLTHGGHAIPLRIRSLVGIVPLFVAGVVEQEAIDRLPALGKRLAWFLADRRRAARHLDYWHEDSSAGRAHHLLALPTRERLVRALARILDEREFLSPFGVRSLSRVHLERPYVFTVEGCEHRVEYVPGESDTRLFGGNSNWRGPVWLPMNWLLLEALERYGHFYGDSLRVECPVGSGRMLTLGEVAQDILARLVRLFLPAADGSGRPCHGGDPRFARDPAWRDLVLFHEHFDGEDGRGLGASQQGWTTLVTRCLRAMRKGGAGRA